MALRQHNSDPKRKYNKKTRVPLPAFCRVPLPCAFAVCLAILSTVCLWRCQPCALTAKCIYLHIYILRDIIFSHRLWGLGKPFYIEKTNILAPPKEVATVCPASRFWALGATFSGSRNLKKHEIRQFRLHKKNSEIVKSVHGSS